ncbi:hypothetical protein [Streptomyces sp. PTD5-9]|uniref:hypothetical protein n=1 Tax=Streptomyces sp. PTD5-9 TaxID=3120150 RepID=UPI00300B4433
MTTWGLVMEMTRGGGERKHTEAYVVAHVDGTREEALLELERRARDHTPEHPWSQKRRRLLRTGDGFLLVVDGAWQSFSTRFTVAELLEDSAAPEPEPEPEPEPNPEPEPGPGPGLGLGLGQQQDSGPEPETGHEPPAPAPPSTDQDRPERWLKLPAKRHAEQQAEPPEEQRTERYADGVPVRPAWLGRADLP